MSQPQLQHYIYKIINRTTGEYYIGKRSCVDWRTDNYMGSGFLLKRKMEAHPDHEWEKIILALLDSEEEAFENEEVVIGQRYKGGCDHDDLCLNLMPGGRGGLAGVYLERRELWTESWEDLPIEDYPTHNLYFSNHNSKVYVTIATSSIVKDTIRSLLDAGFVWGATLAYRHVTLGELGLSYYTPREDILKMIQDGNLLDSGLNNFEMSNHEEKIRTKFHASNRALTICRLLLSRGWVVGCIHKYTYKNIRELKLDTNSLREASYLNGDDCNVEGFRMFSPCKTKYILIKSKKGKPYPNITTVLYNQGWRFGRCGEQIDLTTLYTVDQDADSICTEPSKA